MTVPQETGWLPDCVYTGEKFERELAFFSNSLGRITRFSREAADLAAAKRLPGQAALPGLNNGHSQVLHRLIRGRAERRARAQPAVSPWQEMEYSAASRVSGDDIYD